jgi:hypothetical protein
VLLSITQRISWFAKDFLALLESVWTEANLPVFFQPPQDPEKERLWNRCLRSCEDYFGQSSYEYRLLQKGIVIHHGKMPGLMARMLVEVVQERIIHFVLATSTLSVGVNLPIETILLSSVLRVQNRMSVREFSNLAGRAGRPGFGTEGRCLVLLDSTTGQETSSARERYNELVRELKAQSAVESGDTEASSPLAQLLRYLASQWTHLSGSTDLEEFYAWLEQSAPLQASASQYEDPAFPGLEALDTLDSILLAILAEMEQTEEGELSDKVMEELLRQVWQRSYAHYADSMETDLEEFFVRRGRAIKQHIYTDRVRRRRLYRTSLPPRTADKLLDLYQDLKAHLLTGANYARWSSEQRFDYVRRIAELLGRLPKFALPEPVGGSWSGVLRWWLNPRTPDAPRPATPEQISTWFDYVSDHFIYRLNWGLGSVIALVSDEVYGGKLLEPSLENWPILGLPSIVFWLKELITWGTLEPVAAYLLARRLEGTRPDAEEAAKRYEQERAQGILVPDELFNAGAIRTWAETYAGQRAPRRQTTRPAALSVELARDFSHAPRRTWRVLPVEVDDRLLWVDPAGFHLATCPRPHSWEAHYLYTFDFLLDSSERVVSPSSYI